MCIRVAILWAGNMTHVNINIYLCFHLEKLLFFTETSGGFFNSLSRLFAAGDDPYATEPVSMYGEACVQAHVFVWCVTSEARVFIPINIKSSILVSLNSLAQFAIWISSLEGSPLLHHSTTAVTVNAIWVNGVPWYIYYCLPIYEKVPIKFQIFINTLISPYKQTLVQCCDDDVDSVNIEEGLVARLVNDSRFLSLQSLQGIYLFYSNIIPTVFNETNILYLNLYSLIGCCILWLCIGSHAYGIIRTQRKTFRLSNICWYVLVCTFV